MSAQSIDIYDDPQVRDFPKSTAEGMKETIVGPFSAAKDQDFTGFAGGQKTGKSIEKYKEKIHNANEKREHIIQEIQENYGCVGFASPEEKKDAIEHMHYVSNTAELPEKSQTRQKIERKMENMEESLHHSAYKLKEVWHESVTTAKDILKGNEKDTKLNYEDMELFANKTV